MEQVESLPKLEENTEHLETNVESVSTAPFAIGKSDKENECTESLSPAADPLLLETGTGGKIVASFQQPVEQLCHKLLRRWHELQPETKYRLRSQLRVQSSPSTDNIVTIELSDEEDEVPQQSNTKTTVVNDAADTALGDTLQKDDGEPKIANDLMTEEKNVETLALSVNELVLDGRGVMQEEDMTTDNTLEQEADEEDPSSNNDEEMFTCAVKEKNITLEDEVHASGGNIQNLVLQTISKDMMPVLDLPEQQPANKDRNERIVNKISKSTVHPDSEINVHTLPMSEDKLETEVRRDKSKLLHENQSKIKLLDNDVPENKSHKKYRSKHIADHFNIIKKKKVSSKIQNIRPERDLVVRNENISTLREQVEKTSEDKLETEVRRDKSKLLHENQSKIKLLDNDVPENKSHRKYRSKHIADHLNIIKKKKVSSKRQKIRPERELVVRNENISTLREQVEKTSEDKLETEVRRDKSKLLHENQSTIKLLDNDVPEQKNHKKYRSKHIADHLNIIKKKKVSSKIQNIRPERDLVVRNENISTLREQVEKTSEDKLETEVRRDKSKLLHENQSKIKLLDNDVPEQKNHKKYRSKHIADHLNIIKKKKVSSKRQKIRPERELVVRNENISTLREQVEKTRSDSIQPNVTLKDMTVCDNMSDQKLQTFRKCNYVRKSISEKAYEGSGENSKKVSKDNNLNTTLNVNENLDEGYRLFSNPKSTVIGDYLIHEDNPDPCLGANILANNVNNDNARSEVDIISDKNSLSPETNILKELEEMDVSNVETIIDFDSGDENATINNEISGNAHKNSSNQVTKTLRAFRRNKTQGDNETKNIERHDNRENSWTVNVNNVIKTYKGYNHIRKRKSCNPNHEISKQASAVTDKNNDATILETGSDNAKGCNNNHYSHKKPRKSQQNESIKLDIVNLLRDHNYVDMNRRSSCSSACVGPNNAEVEVATVATDPKLLMRPVVVSKKLTDQIWDDPSLSHTSRPSTPINDLPSLTHSSVASHKSSSLVPPQGSRTSQNFSTPAPKSVKKRRAKKMLLNEEGNERSRLTKKVELPDIEEVRRHNRNMLTAQVTPITQRQGGPVNTASCDHNKSPTSSSSAPLAGCARPACAGDGEDGDGRRRRGAASRARSFITTFTKKRKCARNVNKAERPLKYKSIFGAVKPYRRKRRRRRPRLTAPSADVSGDKNMPTRDHILENEEATASDNHIPHSETITSNCSDTPSTLNEGLPTHNLATDQTEQDTILSSNSVTGVESVPSTVQKEKVASDAAPSVLTEGTPKKNLITVQRERKTTRHSNVVTKFESSGALIKCVSMQNLSKSRKEQEPPRSLKRVTFNIPTQDVTASKERKESSVNPLKIGEPRRKRKQVRLRSESPDDVSSDVKDDESEPMRDLITSENNHDTCSLRPASSSAVPVLDEDVSMRELTTAQSNQETNAYHRSSVPSNTAPISNEGLPTQGLTVVCYPNTGTYGFIKPSTSSARDPSILNKNVPTRDVITKLNNQERASKRVTRIMSVPSSPFLIQNKRDTCKRVILPFPPASLNARRSSVGSLLHASKPLTEKLKACEERKQQKQSSNCGFKPLLFRRGSISKKALPKDFASLHDQGTTNFSNAKGNEINRLGIPKNTSNCDSMLASNGTTLMSSTLPIPTQTNLENQDNSLERVSEFASDNSDPNITVLNQLFSSPEVADASQAECDPVIVSVQSLAPQEMLKERNLRTPASELTVQVSHGTNKSSLPVITLKQAKPVCVSYLKNPSREIQDFTSDSKGPKVTQHLPKILNVSYTNKPVKTLSTNCHNLVVTLKRTIPSSEQVTSPMTTHLKKVIRKSDVQSSQQIGRSVESLGPEPIQTRALPKITLKRAQPVFASYHSANAMEVLISDPREEGQEEMHLPRVGDVTGDLHVIQPDDRMGLHLVVSEDEVYNDNLNISQTF